jgi:hypothetical protein
LSSILCRASKDPAVSPASSIKNKCIGQHCCRLGASAIPDLLHHGRNQALQHSTERVEGESTTCRQRWRAGWWKPIRNPEIKNPASHTAWGQTRMGYAHRETKASVSWKSCTNGRGRTHGVGGRAKSHIKITTFEKLQSAKQGGGDQYITAPRSPSSTNASAKRERGAKEERKNNKDQMTRSMHSEAHPARRATQAPAPAAPQRPQARTAQRRLRATS